MKFSRGDLNLTLSLLFIAAAFLAAGCNIVKKESKTAVVLKTENATQADLMKEVNRFAKVSSLKAKVDFHFEDTSYDELGVKEAYRNAPGEITVQRPGMIRLK